MVALTARKFKVDVAPLIVGDTEVCEALRTSGARDFGLSGEVEWLDILVKSVKRKSWWSERKNRPIAVELDGGSYFL